jgi:hypothetical protein
MVGLYLPGSENPVQVSVLEIDAGPAYDVLQDLSKTQILFV